MKEKTILCLNSGSTSLKFSLFHTGTGLLKCLMKGAVEGIGQAQGRLWQNHMDRPDWELSTFFPNARLALKRVVTELKAQQSPEADAVGHRFVSGGPEHFEPELVTDELLRALHGCVPFAPLHLPAELELVAAISSLLPGVPQVICFDTAFHRGMPEVARRIALPESFARAGVHRYGFHGLSCAYVVDHLGAASMGRGIIAHLGSGASLTAVIDGKSIDTTMGMTPTGGMMMATRTGDLDPGVMIYLMRRGLDVKAIERCVNGVSGLLGVSGTSADMKVLLAKREQDPQAKRAVELFCYQASKQVGALAVALNGVDTLAFTGGIGENAPSIRDEICERLTYLGLEVDPTGNKASADLISTPQSRVRVHVVKANEALMIARATESKALSD